MSQTNDTRILATLVKLFNAEGDTVTANALVARCKSTSTRSISAKDRQRVLALQRKGIELDNQGAHAEAEGWFSGALLFVEDALGPEHAGIIDHLNDLAGCRLSGGNYEAALHDYSRLLRITECTYGPDDKLVEITRQYVQRCREGLRAAIGARRLQRQMDLMLQCAKDERAGATSEYRERLHDVAGRLMARRRYAWAVRLYENSNVLNLRNAQPDHHHALLDVRAYAAALRGVGQLALAASMLQQVLTMCNRRGDWASKNDEDDLLLVLSDWQSCLLELGQVRSATETARLADYISNSG